MSEFLDANPPGLWLRMQREAAGLTQEELAHDAGLSVRAISNLERDRTRRPHADSLRRIARSLGLPEAAVAHLIARSRAARLIAADPPPVAGTTEDLNTARRDYPGRSPVVVPRQLPAAVAPFAGRDTELGILDKWLTGAMQGCRKAVGVAVIAGMAGIGKTALAVHWAHRVANDFPDGQLYVDLLGCHPGGQAADASQVMRGFLQALGVAPEQIPAAADEMTALYRSVLAGKRVLVVADNARNSAQVRPLLPSGPGSMIVVTSRSQLTGLVAADGARIWNLDVLSSADATAFMAARLGPDRVEAEACAVEDLARLCGGLPLALAIVAARADLSGWPLAVFAKQLLTAEDRLEALGLDDPAADLRAVFSWSCQQLSSDTRRLFWLLALHPGPAISVPAAASLAGVPAARAATMLRELASACLAAERLPGRYSLHDLLRAYAAEQAAALPEMDADHGAAEHAMFQHYLHMALHAAHLLEPAQPASPEPPATGVILEQAATGDEALTWFDTEREVLLAVLARVAQIGSHVLAQQLAGALEVFFRRRSNWHDLSATQEIALRSAEKLGDIRGRAHAHLHLGHALGRLGDADATRAHLATAVTLSRELHDLSLEAWAHLGVCQLHPDNCDTTELIESSLRALPRETLTVLGSSGVQADVLTGGGMPVTRFSRWRRRLIAAPPPATDPFGYLARVSALLSAGDYEAVLPTHEQAWLFAAGRCLLPGDAPIAVAPVAAFDRVAGKVEFAELCDELGIPQPLVAAHTSVAIGAGIGGSAAARLSVDHPVAREYATRVGAHLRWHGGLTLGYFHVAGLPQFIECNPRTVEPGNAARAGVDFPRLTVALSQGKQLPAGPVIGHPGIRTRSALALAMGAASRTAMLGVLRDCALRRGEIGQATEVLTSIAQDPPSAVPLAVAAVMLLASPGAVRSWRLAAVDGTSCALRL